MDPFYFKDVDGKSYSVTGPVQLVRQLLSHSTFGYIGGIKVFYNTELLEAITEYNARWFVHMTNGGYRKAIKKYNKYVCIKCELEKLHLLINLHDESTSFSRSNANNHCEFCGTSVEELEKQLRLKQETGK